MAHTRLGRGTLGLALLGAATLALASCSGPKPVLYPNAHYQSVGRKAAQADVDDCMEIAKTHGVRSAERGGKVARSTAGGAATGAVAGSVAGAIGGNAGRGAAAGAAGGAAGGLFRGLLRRTGPDPTYRAFVDRCLYDRGYDPIGWQ